MTPPFHLRAAAKRDIPAIVGLLDALNRFEGIEATTDAASLEAALFSPSRAVNLSARVAEMQGEVVGVALYYPGYDTLSASYGFHLADMVVAESHRRQGIGHALVKELAQQALDEEKHWLSLTALKRNASACAFYQSLGMSEVDVAFYAIGKQALTRV